MVAVHREVLVGPARPGFCSGRTGFGHDTTI
ncbi:hypothetical protein VD0003_g7485 [Verticillium dahliae]|nr:hypothetical protein VD0003_g7485 [Verticillium dahliae]